MGFISFLKKIFVGSDADDAELQAARARHGIDMSKKDDIEEGKEEKEAYDPWEEIRNMRVNFFLGSWVNRKFHVIGEDKVKKELEELEKKREEERKAKEEGEVEK